MGLLGGWLWLVGGQGWAEDVTPSIPVTPSETVPAPVTLTGAQPAETVVIDDELPAGATAGGTWEWGTGHVASGTASHGHPAAKGMQQHSVTLAAPLQIPRTGELLTSVWLDPADPPRGVMIKFTLETGEETGVYWEGEEEVFTPGEEEEIWYYGLLPEYGTWTPLVVTAEDLGIEDTRLSGITFVTYDGQAWWDRTVVRPASAAPVPPSPEGTLNVNGATP